MPAKATKRMVGLAFALLANPFLFGVSPAAAAPVTFNICVDEGTVTMPDSVVVNIWGFSLKTGSCAPAQLPGPQLIVNQNDDVTINLTNNLSEPVSIIVPGQNAPCSTPAPNCFKAKTGTYLYEAGTNPAIQIPMGLYGALIVRPTGAPGQAYGAAATAFDHEAVLVLSEIDKNLNNLIDPNTFDLNDYDPIYWLINGKAHPATSHVAATAGNDVLLRYLNAGSTHHTMSLLGMHQRVIATDAFLLPFPLEAVSQTIPAGQTADSIATPPCAGNYALYNRQLRLTTALPGALNHFPGGMQTFMDVTGAPCASPPAANPVLYFSTQDNTAVPGVAGTPDDADIYLLNSADAFARVFDASAVGLPSGADVDAVNVVDADTFYMSFTGSVTIAAIPGTANDTVDDSDIVRFDAGSWSVFFDGSDVGLTTNDEDIDAFDILPDGSVIISTIGAVSVAGVSRADEDLVRCVGTFGPATTCTWSVYFDGSDVGLGGTNEDIDGATRIGADLLLSTWVSGFTVPGLTGENEDIFVCRSVTTGINTACASFSLAFDMTAKGITDNIDAFHAVVIP